MARVSGDTHGECLSREKTRNNKLAKRLLVQDDESGEEGVGKPKDQEAFVRSSPQDQLRLALFDVPYAWLSLGGVVVMVGMGKEKRRATMQGRKIMDKTFSGEPAKIAETLRKN